jgi:small subunit ribosomal protein S8
MSALTDPIADFLTRIRNGCAAKLPEITAPYSRIKGSISQLLQDEGYISGYEVDKATSSQPQIKLKLKYDNRLPVIRNLKRISRPGLRVYIPSDKIPRVLGGLGVCILSTSRGVMTGNKARKQKVGGELLATIW